MSRQLRVPVVWGPLRHEIRRRARCGTHDKDGSQERKGQAVMGCEADKDLKVGLSTSGLAQPASGARERFGRRLQGQPGRRAWKSGDVTLNPLTGQASAVRSTADPDRRSSSNPNWPV